MSESSKTMMFDALKDHELIQACREGDADAFGVLVRRYQDRLYPTVLRMVSSVEDARDILQDTFFRAYQKIDQFQGTSSFYTWVYRIAINLAVSSQRNRRPKLLDFRSRRGGNEYIHHPIDTKREADPSASLDRLERDEQIQKALASLAPEHRAVIVLKDLEDHRYEEIAVLLGIPIGTVRSRLHRARCELRQLLSGFFSNEFSTTHSGQAR